MYINMEKKIIIIRNISVSHEYITYWGLCEFMIHGLVKIEICISKSKVS